MALFFERPVAGPATHVLVIGVSAYAHVAQGAIAHRFKLKSLASAAPSAERVASALTELVYPPAPIATIDLLLAPLPGMTMPANAKIAERNEVKDALDAWYERCCAPGRSPHRGLLYFAGHGFQYEKEGGLVGLLSDFGKSPADPFQGAIDFGAVRRAMMGPNPGTAHLPLAQQGCPPEEQVFVLDACRAYPETSPLQNEWQNSALSMFPAPLQSAALKCSAVLFATAAGTSAYGEATAGTLFSQALLSALKGAAFLPADDRTDAWHVTINSLRRGVRQELAALGQRYQVIQDAELGGRVGDDPVLLVSATAPTVTAEFSVDPVAAGPRAVGDVASASKKNAPVKHTGHSFAEPLRLALEAGFYKVDVRIVQPEAGLQDTSETVWVEPNKRRVAVRISS